LARLSGSLGRCHLNFVGNLVGLVLLALYVEGSTIAISSRLRASLRVDCRRLHHTRAPNYRPTTPERRAVIITALGRDCRMFRSAPQRAGEQQSFPVPHQLGQSTTYLLKASAASRYRKQRQRERQWVRIRPIARVLVTPHRTSNFFDFTYGQRRAAFRTVEYFQHVRQAIALNALAHQPSRSTCQEGVSVSLSDAAIGRHGESAYPRCCLTVHLGSDIPGLGSTLQIEVKAMNQFIERVAGKVRIHD
jgi:hypothetical protein